MKLFESIFLCLIVSIGLTAFGANTATGGNAAELALAVYVIEPITKQRILPDTPISSFPLVAKVTDTTLKISACRGEFEPASFVIRPRKALTNINIAASDLKGPNGAVIPSSVVDIRVVKCWYQAGNTPDMFKGPKTLVPELLLRDDSLVKVDYVTKMNFLKVKIDDKYQYLDITSADAQLPKSTQIYDAETLQPFDIQADANKQLWITIKVPMDAAAGDYTGTITLSSGATPLYTMKSLITVLPFDLPLPAIEFGLYYIAQLKTGGPVISSYLKNAKQYSAELQNMKNHGVLYPTLYQDLNNPLLSSALSIRKGVGLPTDKLYSNGWYTQSARSATDFEKIIRQGKKIVDEFGYRELYVYGKDEAKQAELQAQRPLWQAAHSAGARVFAAVWPGAYTAVGDLVDLANFNGYKGYNSQDVEGWHKLGKKVFIYCNPQVGFEDPEIYRRNYGIQLICNGYDGSMNFAYQYGSEYVGTTVWNDFDAFGTSGVYRDHVFAYPTSDGVIDTIEWEGFREAIDDVRYLTMLAAATDTGAYRSVCNTLRSNTDLTQLRSTIISRILAATAQNK
jgi:hypothetical protein